MTFRDSSAGRRRGLRRTADKCPVAGDVKMFGDKHDLLLQFLFDRTSQRVKYRGPFGRTFFGRMHGLSERRCRNEEDGDSDQ